MRDATRITVATFGTLAGLAGIEHGVGEVLQGNRAPDGIVFASWADAAAFRIVAGEPAMSIVPNLLVTGVLAILVSLVVIAWATMFVQRRHGGLILILLSLMLLLVGGGFGPPLLGVILGVAATRLNTPLRWWRTRLPVGVRHALDVLWSWSFTAALIAWLLVMPGSMLLDFFVGINEATMYTFILAAFALLLLTIGTALAYDADRKGASQPALPING
jgi:hypothetical protein